MKLILAAICTFAASLGCQGGAGFEQRSPSATPTPVTTKGQPCEGIDFPTAMLVTNEAEQAGRQLTTNWNDPVTGCNLQAHPFGELLFPSSPLVLSAEAPVVLNLSRAPNTLEASVWHADILSMSPIMREGYSEILDFDYSAPRVEVPVRPVDQQEIDLNSIGTDGAIVSVVASFHEGQLSWVFWVMPGA